MSKPAYNYNGFRNLFLPDKNFAPLKTLWRISGSEDDDLARRLALFNEFDVVVVYHESGNQYREKHNEQYLNCTFQKGILSTVDSKSLVLTAPHKPVNPDTHPAIPLGQVLDVIISDSVPVDTILPEDALRRYGPLKIFSLDSTDPTKTPDMYKIIAYDPVSAFVLANNNYGMPLYLTQISDLYPGIQYNKGRGDTPLM